MLCRHNQIKILLFRVPTWQPGRMTISKVRAERWETAGEIMYCRTQGLAVRCTLRLSPPASRGWPSPRQQSKRNTWGLGFYWNTSHLTPRHQLISIWSYILRYISKVNLLRCVSLPQATSLNIKFELQGNSQQGNSFVLDLKGEIFQTLLCQVEAPPAGNTGETNRWR